MVATTRRLASDSGAFADWVASSASNAAAADKSNDLSLGFNAGPAAAATGSAAAAAGSLWPASSRAAAGSLYGIPPEMGMFVVAPATSFQHESNLMVDAHHHHHHHHHSVGGAGGGVINGGNNAATALGVGVGVGVIPLFNAGPCLNVAGGGGGETGGGGLDGHDSFMGRNRTGAIQLWQTQQQQQMGGGSNYPKKSINFDPSGPSLLHSSTTSAMGCGGGGGALTCQDCGNQAKKDCNHRRCRTCCRSRGFDCSTHVKSTWVPAARRRERQMMGAPGTAGTHGAGGGSGGGGASSGSTSGAKKPRLISSQNTTTTSHTSTSNTPPRSFDTSSSHQDASFKESLPGQVRAPAVFKCVKVTAVDDGEDEFAYQAVVKIGGHVFKGFLYDQGVEPREGFPNLSELHLGGGASSSGAAAGRNAGASTSSPLLDPSDVYGASGSGGLLGGSSYGNAIN